MRQRILSLFLVLSLFAGTGILPCAATNGNDNRAALAEEETALMETAGAERDVRADSAGQSVQSRTERYMTVSDRKAEGKGFRFLVHLTGEAEGTVAVAVYAGSGQMKESRLLPAESVLMIHIEQVEQEDRAKVMWLDGNNRPLCESLEIRLRERTIYSRPMEVEHIARGTLTADGEPAESYYIDNEIILEAGSGVTPDEVQALAASSGGSIVGYHEILNHYQVGFAESKSLEQLTALATELGESPLIDDAYLNLVYPSEPDLAPYAPKDCWDGDLLNEGKPHGNNWGIEAINLPSAWALLNSVFGEDGAQFPTLTIGIIDSLFDRNHPDLNQLLDCWSHYGDYNARTKAAQATAKTYSEYSHGTHVAGILGAAINNKRGIAGVAMHPAMYGFSVYHEGLEEFWEYLQSGFSIFYFEEAFEHFAAMSENQTKLYRKILVNYSRGDPVSPERITSLLRQYEEKGYDFLIVATAGNNKDKNAMTNSGFCGVTDSEIMRHILVVGAAYSGLVENGEDFSNFYLLNRGTVNDVTKNYNYGSRIEVAAPGQDIYSCVPPNQNSDWGSDGKEYKNMTGTSMAAPMAAGVAALVWAANPALPAAQVKWIIVETANIPLRNVDAAGLSHPMINAANAVSLALGEPYVIQGACGEDVGWTFDSDSGELNIFGKGDMTNYDDAGDDLPWYRYKEQIRSVVFGDEVTSVGDYAFCRCKALKSLTLGAGIRNVGCSAFLDCTALSSVKWGGSLDTIQEDAFFCCAALTQLPEFPKSLREIGAGAFRETRLTGYHFTGTAPTVQPAGSGEASSFSYDKDTGGLTIFYPAKDRTWTDRIVKNPETDEEYWLGYHARPEQLAVHGRVINQLTLEAVPNAQVTIQNMMTGEKAEPVQTDALGFFTAYPPGTVPTVLSAEISAEGYTSKTEIKTVDAKSFYWQEILLYPTACPVTVTLLKPDGSPAAGIAINGTGLSTVPKTDGEGRASFTVEPGTYALNAETKLTLDGSTDTYFANRSVNVRGKTELTLTLAKAWMEYNIDPETQTLHIYGAGPMPDYSANQKAPWRNDYIGYTGVVITGLTSVGSEAFYHSTRLTHVELSSSVTEIKDWAFAGCTGLTVSPISSGVIRIGSGAFSGCTGLTVLSIPDSVTEIGNNTFSACTGLTAALLPDSLSVIPQQLFSGCTELTFVSIPDSVTDIQSRAFAGCAKLKDVLLPEGLAALGKETFCGCAALDELTVPASVLKVGEDVVKGCATLNSVTICGNDTKCQNAFRADCALVLRLADGVTVIPNVAYYGCTGLIGLEFSDKITEIGKSAFSGCSGLSGPLMLPVGTETVGDSAFYQCTGLTELVLPSGLTGVGESAFSGCEGLTGVLRIPASVNKVGKNAFSNCGALTEVIIFGSQTVCAGAFPDGSLLLTLSEGVTSLPSGAFSECKGLVSLNNIPASMIEIGGRAFSGCTSLSGVLIIPAGVEVIGGEAFYNCGGLTGLVLSEGLSRIESRAFMNCTGLTDVAIPNSVSYIGGLAFYGCTGLTSASVPGDREIENYLDSYQRVFSECTNLTCLTVNPGSPQIPNWSFQDWPGEIAPLPDSVTSIGRQAFSGCTGLTNLSFLPDSVTEIGVYSFLKCTGLQGSISLPANLTLIDYGAFSGCTGMTELCFQDALTQIKAQAFHNCTGLTKVILPASLEKIGEGVFMNCTSLTRLVFRSENAPSIGHGAFDSVTATAYYPNTWGNPPTTYGGTITWVAYDPAEGLPE